MPLTEELTEKVLKRELAKTDIDGCKEEDLADVVKLIAISASTEGLRRAEKLSIDPELSPVKKLTLEQYIDTLTDGELITLQESRYEKLTKGCSPAFLRETLYECTIKD